MAQIFEAQSPVLDGMNTAQPNGKWTIQDGGLRTFIQLYGVWSTKAICCFRRVTHVFISIYELGMFFKNTYRVKWRKIAVSASDSRHRHQQYLYTDEVFLTFALHKILCFCYLLPNTSLVLYALADSLPFSWYIFFSIIYSSSNLSDLVELCNSVLTKLTIEWCWSGCCFLSEGSQRYSRLNFDVHIRQTVARALK